MHTSFRALVEAYSDSQFYFIQIGANDGITDDDIRSLVLERRWRGLMVEPLPDVFAALRSNYQSLGNRLQFSNTAITSAVGPVEFWRHPSLPQCSGLGVRTRIQYRSAMEKVEVEGITWQAMLDRYEVKRLDLLQIDTEGYDAEIIRMFPFDRLRPLIIRYEHKHLNMDDRQALEESLREKGYLLFWEKHDTVAYLPL